MTRRWDVIVDSACRQRNVDRAVARVNARLAGAGFDEAMAAALAAEDVLAADETPVNVLDKTPLPAPAPEEGEADPEEKDGKPVAGAPHVPIIRTPDGRLTSLLALASRRKESVGGVIPAAFAGNLMTDGYVGYVGYFCPGSRASSSAASTSSAAAGP